MNDYREFLNKIEDSNKKKKKKDEKEDVNSLRNEIVHDILKEDQMDENAIKYCFDKFAESNRFFKYDYLNTYNTIKTEDDYINDVKFIIDKILFVPFAERYDIILKKFEVQSKTRNFNEFLSKIRDLIGFDGVEDIDKKLKFQKTSAEYRIKYTDDKNKYKDIKIYLNYIIQKINERNINK